MKTAWLSPGVRAVFLLALGFGFVGAAEAQTIRVLGDLTTTSNLAPFNLSQNSVRYQVAYSSTELNVPSGGLITQVRIHGAVAASQPVYGQFRLRMAHSTLTPQTITSTFAGNYYGTLDEVIGPATVSPTQSPGQNALSWWTFVLTTPYVYNGTDTLLLDWSYESRTGGFNVSSAAGRMRQYIRPGNYQSPTAATIGDSGNHGIEFTIIEGPTLTVTAGTNAQAPVYANAQGAGANGIQAADFTIASNSIAGVSLASIEVEASGTGDDATAFTDVAVYRDDNSNGTFEPTDVLIGTAGNFTADDGTIVFNVQAGAEQAFGTSETRNYFVVARMAGTAQAGETFDFAIKDITVTGTNANKSGVPTVAMPGLLIETPLFAVTDTTPAGVQQAVLGGSSVCQVFMVNYAAGPDDKPATVTVSSLGTADESSDLTDVELWYDLDDDGAYLPANDTLVDTQSFTQDDGMVDFGLASHPAFQAGQTRRFFVVYNLNTGASHQETFKCYVSAFGAASLGGTASGLPAPGPSGTDGLEVSSSVLIATLNGPLAAVSVDSNSQGSTGDGELLCDINLAAAPGGNWTVADLVFVASGTGAHDSAFNELALYESTGGSWAGAGSANLAAAMTAGYSGGVVTFALTDPDFPQGTDRRFFLVGKMSGAATTGQTFNARLESINATPPANGSTVGIPTLDTTALIINTPVLTVANTTTQPTTTTHRAGTAGTYTIASFRLTALNDTVTINGVNLTTGGTGDWTSDVSATTGVQVFRDDGDGVFNAADTMLFQGAGAAVVAAAFSPALTMPVTSTADLWVRIGFTATAGQGAVALPETFTLSIAAATDVNATTAAVLGTPAPSGISIGAIEFSVTSFVPSNDLPAGGKAITITGTGFVAPLTVTIGGVPCGGTPIIVGGTQVTGFVVPPGSGTGLPIEVTSATLPPQTITQTFSYSKVGSVGGDGGDSGSGCAPVGGSAWALLLAMLVLTGVVAARRQAA